MSDYLPSTPEELIDIARNTTENLLPKVFVFTSTRVYWFSNCSCHSSGKNIEEEIERCQVPFRNLPENFLWMQVKGGSKMVNLLSHVSGILKDKASTAIVWSGTGVAIPKVISCAEILKRQFSIEHQVTKLVYKKVEEYWEPKLDGLETIVVKRQIPVIHILLSKDAICDSDELGYQSFSNSKFWERCPKTSTKRKNLSRKPFIHKQS